MTQKKTIAVLFGGQSPEHAISLRSAEFILKNIPEDRFEILAIGIEQKTGFWYLQSQWTSPLSLNTEAKQLVSLLPDHRLYHVNTKAISEPLDLVFPILHGPNGEDGTIQGLLQLFRLPFVGAACLGTAIGMDKDVSKRLLREAGLPTPAFKTLHMEQLNSLNLDALIEEFGLPCFVKPANMGSSYGISKVCQREDLKPALELAFRYDRKVLIEEAIIGRELECAVMGNAFPKASLPCEIVLKREYYDFTAKYEDAGGTEFQVPADIEPALAEELKSLALKAYRCLDCQGLARVDFFLSREGKLYLNELNTLPGFTAMSMYPRMWQACGVEGKELIMQLLDYALEAFDQRENLQF